jgi:small-conductance mechanosensitive channel
MLLEAARRTEHLDLEDSPPYITQSALSDFYVEYRLTVVINNPDRRRATFNALHAAIQDVFNENNVQIMSPHYEGDPLSPKVVPTKAKDPGLASPQ